MALHHAKHHNTYVTNFNIAMEKYAEAEAKGDYATMISLQGAIKFNGGGTFLTTHPMTEKTDIRKTEKHSLVTSAFLLPCPLCLCTLCLSFSSVTRVMHDYVVIPHLGTLRSASPRLSEDTGFCVLLAGHVNHSIFWKNLAPPKVRCSFTLCNPCHTFQVRCTR